MLNKYIFWFQKIKQIIRILISELLYITGFLSLLATIKLRNKAVILMYHRVLNTNEISESCSQDGLIVSKETFETQMKYLKEHFNVISLSTLIKTMYNRVLLKKKSCLVTFDDGWNDNFTNAYPQLKKLGIPAAVFLSTDFIASKKQFWQERLTNLLYLLHDRCNNNQQFREKALSQLQTKGIDQIILSDENHLREVISQFVTHQKTNTLEHVEDLIKVLKDVIRPRENKVQQKETFLNWNELKIMAEDGIAFGSHGKSHRTLTQEESKVVQREIVESKAMLEQKLGMTINSFSFPNGEYTEEVVNIVKGNGYDVAFGTERGFVSPRDDPYKLRRINIHEEATKTLPMFLARILGLW